MNRKCAHHVSLCGQWALEKWKNCLKIKFYAAINGALLWPFQDLINLFWWSNSKNKQILQLFHQLIHPWPRLGTAYSLAIGQSLTVKANWKMATSSYAAMPCPHLKRMQTLLWKVGKSRTKSDQLVSVLQHGEKRKFSFFFLHFFIFCARCVSWHDKKAS